MVIWIDSVSTCVQMYVGVCVGWGNEGAVAFWSLEGRLWKPPFGWISDLVKDSLDSLSDGVKPRHETEEKPRLLTNHWPRSLCENRYEKMNSEVSLGGLWKNETCQLRIQHWVNDEHQHVSLTYALLQARLLKFSIFLFPPQITKQQLQQTKDRFQGFLNGDTQIVADEAFINAVQSYNEVRNHWS